MHISLVEVELDLILHLEWFEYVSVSQNTLIESCTYYQSIVLFRVSFGGIKIQVLKDKAAFIPAVH